MRRITIIQGHPDARDGHLLHALADAYAQAAEAAGHSVRRVEVARLEFPLLRCKADFEHGQPPPAIAEAQAAIAWAQHLVFCYPLWLGSMPALLKGLLEQVFRPGFAFAYGPRGQVTKHLAGRSARIVVTMGMPAVLYRWYYRAHGLKSFERNVLAFSGIGPIRSTLFGMVEQAGERRRQRWLETMRALGRHGR